MKFFGTVFLFSGMILYNITATVDETIREEWLDWMKKTHIPEMLATQRFSECKMFKVLLNKEEGTSYSIQFFADSMAELQLYEALHANELREKHKARFGDKVLTFRTVLEKV